MGKKKNKKEEEELKAPKKEVKVHKSYSLANENQGSKKAQEDDGITKVQIPSDKEGSILDLIIQYKERQIQEGSASLRLSNKKLKDMYTSLARTGFKHKQIEQAMSNTVHWGGDLIDALDWLCLYTPNDQLPTGFSQTMTSVTEEEKSRPGFDSENYEQSELSYDNAVAAASGSASATKLTAGEDTETKPVSLKDLTLQYAETWDDYEDNEGKEKTKAKDFDPNESYIEVVAKLLDAKAAAGAAKKGGEQKKSKELSQNIKQLVQEVMRHETHPQFNPQMKISWNDDASRQTSKEPGASASAKPESPRGAESLPPLEGADTDGDSLGFALLEQQEEKPKPQPEKKTSKQLDKRCFVYTRQQWTGKSPKQFLIDWVRKHLPKSPPPSYTKVNMGGGFWRSKCKVMNQESPLIVCPDIVCDNIKDAEHIASTLALYTLCKGQRVYQLLPPPYRDVWLEWQDAQDRQQQESREEENKPRDQLITRLLKQVKLETAEQEKRETTPEEDVEETWEDLADSDEEDAIDESIKKVPQIPSSHAKGPNPGKLRELMSYNRESARYKELLTVRCELPVFQHKQNIVRAVAQNSVVVIAGETGSGKSTQIPQYILEGLVMEGNPCNMVCTQPRRISATSLAQRVSDEMGEAGPGNPGALCGYQIRFEAKRTSSTRLLYCTTGILLRVLQADPSIAHITHVIVDEVHERSVESDFLLILLRQLQQRRPDLRLILMSATLDADKFSIYFNNCPVFNIAGRAFPVEVHHIEDIVEWTGYRLEEDSFYSRRQKDLIDEERTSVQVTQQGGNSHTVDATWSRDDISTIDQSGLDPQQYGKQTRNIITRLHPNRVNLELIVTLLLYLDESADFSAICGAVLVFLPGLSHIQELNELLTTDRRFADKSRYRIVPLHSVLSSKDQSMAFDIPPNGVRKIVIATNIAETGITIPDVVFVIDSGKAKENRYIESSQMSVLEEVFISAANATQRQGRAGRVQPGVCFRLYTQAKRNTLRPYTVPEMLRVPLEELCLHIMKSELGHPVEFLSKAIDPPLIQAISSAMSVLRQVGACPPLTPTLTPLGHHLSGLPVNVRIGKMLIYSALLGCLEPIAVLSASMADKSPYAVPMGQRQQADAARRGMATDNSDQITLYKAFVGWKNAQKQSSSAERIYCQQCFLKRNSMHDIERVACDLVRLVRNAGFDEFSGASLLGKKPSGRGGAGSSVNWEPPSPRLSALMKSVLTAGLYPNVAHISHTPKVDQAASPEQQVCVGETQQGQVATHPASVNSHLAATGWLIFHEKVKLSRVYLRDSSLVSPFPILLFGGELTVQHASQLICVDNWIKFKAFAKTAVIFKELRLLIDDLLQRKLKDPKLKLAGESLVHILLDLLIAERRR